ncbi:ATP-dependent Clp protease proteolytic subunit 4, chloroplastic [Populus nigra]|uniref:ATP-dependent Clp protease proteolytic subunit 4, chloroplastic n=1 Tax=Populus nigra TaxID=3691 RepID=UPI002B27984B|nr:ATP-dependent Clp protease proteolytic subunit 4, chloroplastic [Populus nigra]XP_061981505.1 ATP-dependent Clp protease proteolytic subunit 4, chloroplastic [Populus nigra]XP_061981506.1 ATP-dependent Clp protease proteolytic subunit 4, chloroplastic [Populus nigra]
MDLLSLSSSTATPLFSSLKPTLSPHHNLKPPTSPFPFLFKPLTPSSPKLSPLKTSLKSSLTLTPIPQLASPQTPATSMRGAETDAMGLLLRERIVFLGNNIDDFVADAIISQLLLLDAQDPTKDIRLFVNCPGGSLSASMAIYDVVQLVRADVSTIALGISASTASIILGGGTKGKRFAMPNTRIMIHQPLGGASGQAIDVEIQAREIMHNKNNIIRIVSGFTSRTVEQVQKDMDRDRYMSPIEAVEYGIIDGVIDRDSIIPLAPVPERVTPTLNYEDMRKDPMKFLNPDVPDDEIY